MLKKIINYIENHKTLVAILILALPVLILTPSKIGIFQKEDAQTIVSYLGAIIGGSLTLVGVWWTINEQKMSKTEELSLQYKPILSIKCHFSGICLNFIEIKNNGRGEAIVLNGYLENSTGKKDFQLNRNIITISAPRYIEINLLIIEKTTIKIEYTDFLNLHKYELISEIEYNNKLIVHETINLVDNKKELTQ